MAFQHLRRLRGGRRGTATGSAPGSRDDDSSVAGLEATTSTADDSASSVTASSGRRVHQAHGAATRPRAPSETASDGAEDDFLMVCVERIESKRITAEAGARLSDPQSGVSAAVSHDCALFLTSAERRERSPLALTEALCASISSHLPARLRNAQWRAAFLSQRDGFSAKAFQAVAHRLEENVIVITTADGDIFGAYSTRGYGRSLTYEGDGEVFLWSLPSFLDPNCSPLVTAFHTTGRNQYYVHTSMDFNIHFGGGGHSGLFLHKDMQSGETGICETFGNPPLCQPQEGSKESRRSDGSVRFKIRQIEVYSVLPDTSISVRQTITTTPLEPSS